MSDSLECAFAPVLAADTDARVVVDPWAPGALATLGARRPANVLVIGSELTGVDVALHLIARGSTVTLLSRNGALPHRFRYTGAPADVPHLDALGSEISLEQLRGALDADLTQAREAGKDWRQVIDAIRPHTARLWRSMGWEDQRRFLREDLRQWEIVRHRMPPTIADAIDTAIGGGQLTVAAGEVADVGRAVGFRRRSLRGRASSVRPAMRPGLSRLASRHVGRPGGRRSHQVVPGSGAATIAGRRADPVLSVELESGVLPGSRRGRLASTARTQRIAHEREAHHETSHAPAAAGRRGGGRRWLDPDTDRRGLAERVAAEHDAADRLKRRPDAARYGDAIAGHKMLAEALAAAALAEMGAAVLP
jgi:hypothetical protein